MARETWRRECCAYCERKLLAPTARSNLAATRDHAPIPKSKGGSAWVWACWRCNTMKGDVDYDVWLQFMADHPGWWKGGGQGAGAPFSKARRIFARPTVIREPIRFKCDPEAVKALAREIAREMDEDLEVRRRLA